MPDLSVNFAGITSPNPFWLASAPPTNSGAQVMRAFDHGWGGAVWKTLGDPIVNVSSRFGSLSYNGKAMIGFNNIELITDRPLDVNFREIAEVKKRYPKNTVIVSLMVETRDEWRDIIRRSEDTGADGLELNFGCPHGMCERGMGSAVGQEPKVCEEITSWAVDASSIPVIVKLTPNISDINRPGEAAVRGGAHALSLINTIKSIIGVDLKRATPLPYVAGKSTNGGYCGPAVRPIALHMLSQLAQNPNVGVPISGIGGIETWHDALEFIYLGATTVQVCTAVMHYGYRIVREMIEGTENFMRENNFKTIDEMIGKAVPNYTEWGVLDLNYKRVAKIDATTCIGCQLCHVACWDGAHQCIHPQPTSRVPVVDENECVGCNLCQYVCPVAGCITMEDVQTTEPPMNWLEYSDLLSQGKITRRFGH
ncbi:MAG: NAD-dependent dihydropyrimidine dehydrogenase subunit PreA [Myxococcales bacterium]|nr:NAD-dependent dihydropyrimidine dehydrogenase subunit PreA [Myxococcales bacterium]